MGWAVASLGSTTNLTVTGASAMGALHGEHHTVRHPVCARTSKNITATPTAVLSVRVRREFNSRVCQREFRPLHLNASIETANRAATLDVLINPTIVTGAQLWTFVDQSRSSIEKSTSSVTVTGGTYVASISVSSGAPTQIDLDEFAIRLEAGDVMVVVADTVSGSADLRLSLNGHDE